MKKKQVILLGISCGIIFGYAYGLDTPQALQVPLRQQPYNFTSTQFNLLYFATYLPVPILDIPIGIIMGRTSLKISMFALLVLSVISQLIISLMFQFRPSGYFIVILFMRALFGIAGEGAFTGQAIFIQQYTKNNYEFIMALSLSLPFIFDSLNSLITTAVYDSTNYLPLTWYIGCIVCFVSLVSCLLMIWFITKYQNNKNQEIISDTSSQKQSFEDKKQLEQQHFRCEDFKKFGKIFWILMIAVFFSQTSLGPFLDNLNQLIVKRFSIPYVHAGTLLLIPFTFLLVFSLILGKLLSIRPKWRRGLYLVGTSFYGMMQLILYLIPNSEEAYTGAYIVSIFFLLSMSFSFGTYYCALLPAITYIVDKKSLGTAWGCVGVFIGLSACILPLINMVIIDSDTDLSISYKNLTLFGLMMAIISILLSVYIFLSKDFIKLDLKLIDQQNQNVKKNNNSMISENTEEALKQQLMK